MFIDLARAARIERGEAALARTVADGVAAGGGEVAIDPIAGGYAALARFWDGYDLMAQLVRNVHVVA